MPNSRKFSLIKSILAQLQQKLKNNSEKNKKTPESLESSTSHSSDNKCISVYDIACLYGAARKCVSKGKIIEMDINEKIKPYQGSDFRFDATTNFSCSYNVSNDEYYLSIYSLGDYDCWEALTLKKIDEQFIVKYDEGQFTVDLIKTLTQPDGNLGTELALTQKAIKKHMEAIKSSDTKSIEKIREEWGDDLDTLNELLSIESVFKSILPLFVADLIDLMKIKKIEAEFKLSRVQIESLDAEFKINMSENGVELNSKHFYDKPVLINIDRFYNGSIFYNGTELSHKDYIKLLQNIYVNVSDCPAWIQDSQMVNEVKREGMMLS